MKHFYLLLITTLFCINYAAFSQEVSSNSPICLGNPLELKANGGKTFVWKGPNGFTSNQQNPTIEKTISENAGNYSVTIDGTTTLSVDVKVGKAYISSVQAFTSTVSSTLTLISYYNSPASNLFTVSWVGPNNFTSNKPSPSINGFTKNDQGIYTATIKDEFGCISKASIDVKFDTPDCPYVTTINAEVNNNIAAVYNYSNYIPTLSICKGSPFVLRVDTAYYGKALIVQWYRDNVLIPGVNAPKQAINEDGIYHAIISNGTCEYQSSRIQVSSRAALSVKIVNDASENTSTICNNGGYERLYASADLSLAKKVSYQWLKNGELINDAINYNYLVSSEGEYKVIAKADNCVGSSSSFKVEQKDKIPAKLTFYANNENTEIASIKDLKVCTENPQNIWLQAKGGGYQEIYLNNKLYVSNYGQNYNLNSFANAIGTYKLKITKGSCVSTDSVIISKSNNFTIPLNEYITLPTYSYTSKGSNVWYSPHEYDSYKANNYIWYKDGKFYNDQKQLTPYTPGNYQLKYNDPLSGCSGESRVVKIDNPLIELKFKINGPKSVNLCKGSIYKLSPNYCYYDVIVWKKDGKIILPPKYECDLIISEGGKYWYEYTNENHTYYSDTVEVKTEDIFALTLKDSCLTNNTFALIVNNIPDAQYHWIKNNQDLQGKIGSSLNITEFGTYYVQVIKNGCVSISNTLEIGISLPSIQNLCKNDSIIISPTGALKNYQWSGPNNFSSSLRNVRLPKSTASMAGTYTLKGEASNGCIITAQSTITVNDFPIMNLAKILTACEGSDFEFPRPTSKLTDSTETADFFNIIYPDNSIKKVNSYEKMPTINNISSKNQGVYVFKGFANNGGCSVINTTQINVVNTTDCKSISLDAIKTGSLTIPVCNNSSMQIHFKTTGVFTQGTKFKVVTTENILLGEGITSPISIKVPKNYNSFDFRIITDDKTVSSSLYTKNVIYSYFNQDIFIRTSPNATNYPEYSGYVTCDSTLFYVNNDAQTFKNFQWFLDNKAIPNATSNKLQVKQSGSYSLNYEMPNGCILETETTKITIGVLPIVKLEGDNQILCGQETAKITAYYSEGNITWKRGNLILAGKNSAQLETNQVGKYTATIQQNKCIAVSDTFEITKSNSNQLKVDVLNNLSNIGCSGFKADLVAKTSYDSKNMVYQWLKNGVAIPNTNKSAFSTTENGSYTVTVNNGTCIGISKELVLSRPAIPIAKYVNSHTEYCVGSTIFLNFENPIPIEILKPAEKDSALPTYKTVKNTILWYRDNIQISESVYQLQSGHNFIGKSNDNIAVVSEDGNHIYYSYLYGNTPGKYYTLLKFQDEKGQECTISSDTLNIKFSKNIQLDDYIYDKSLKYIPISSCLDTITITGNATSESIYMNGTANNQRAVEYTWKKDGTIFKSLDKKEASDRIITNQEGTYVLETRNKSGCVSLSRPYKVTFGKLALTVRNLNNSDNNENIYDNNICEGINISLNGYVTSYNNDTTKINYKWLKDGVSLSNLSYITTNKAGSYQLKASQGKCEGTSETIKVNFVKIPTSISPKDSITFCDNATVELIASNENGLKYQWEHNNTSIKDANSSTFKTNNSGIYRALLRKGECWDYSEKVKTIALPTILPKAILTGDQSIDYDKETKISISLNSYAPWTLTFSDGQVFTATTSPFEVNVKPLSTTTYALSEVKNICGIGTTEGSAKIEVIILANDIEKDINVEVYPVPTAEICNWKVSTDKPEKVYLTLYDVSGKNILEQTSENRSQSHSGTIDLSKINTGTYFLKIDVGNKNITRKIIKY